MYGQRQSGEQPGEGISHYLGRVIDEEAAKGPMKPASLDENGNPVFPEDPAVWGKVQHTMHSREKLGQWFARTGLGRAQIFKMTKKQISDFVAQADRNLAEDDGGKPRPTRAWTEQPAHSGTVTILV